MINAASRPGGTLDELANLAAQVSFAPAAIVALDEHVGWIPVGQTGCSPEFIQAVLPIISQAAVSIHDWIEIRDAPGQLPEGWRGFPAFQCGYPRAVSLASSRCWTDLQGDSMPVNGPGFRPSPVR